MSNNNNNNDNLTSTQSTHGTVEAKLQEAPPAPRRPVRRLSREEMLQRRQQVNEMDWVAEEQYVGRQPNQPRVAVQRKPRQLTDNLEMEAFKQSWALQRKLMDGLAELQKYYERQNPQGAPFDFSAALQEALKRIDYMREHSPTLSEEKIIDTILYGDPAESEPPQQIDEYSYANSAGYDDDDMDTEYQTSNSFVGG